MILIQKLFSNNSSYPLKTHVNLGTNPELPVCSRHATYRYAQPMGPILQIIKPMVHVSMLLVIKANGGAKIITHRLCVTVYSSFEEYYKGSAIWITT